MHKQLAIQRQICFVSISFLILLLILSSARVDAAGFIDPSLRFSTIETDHFLIHFHQGTEDIARYVSELSEEIHDRISPIFQWSPAEKTQLVLVDRTDFANGLTTVLPYNVMYLFLVPPFPEMTTGEYEDWLEILIIHEYAHVLAMDPVRGYSSVMRKIFGKTLPGSDPLSVLLFFFTAPPNVFMPHWWHEGMSTWAETEFSSGGRGKSSYYEMIYRMAVLENNIPRIDQFNGDVPYWPDGNIRYIYGLLLEKYIAQTYGEEILGKINITQAGRLPYFLNAPPTRFTGKHYVKIYKDMVQALKLEQTEKINKLKSASLTEHRIIPFEGERLTNPRLSPNGWYLALNRRDPHRHEDIVIVDSNTLNEISTIRRLPSDHSLSWSSDSTKLYYTQADLSRGVNIYQDIYSFDLFDKTVKRITNNMRAKDIDVSPDGRRVAFIKVVTGVQNLAVMSAEDGKNIRIFESSKDSALSGPRWSPDGKHIVYSRRDNKGNTSIEVLELWSRASDILVKDRHSNIYPTWSPDGRFIIFTSDRTGVFNLFAYSIENQQILQITHLLGGAFQPDISYSKDRIVFSSYSSRGYSIAEMPYEPLQWFAEFSPEIRPLWKEGGSLKPGLSDQGREQSQKQNPSDSHRQESVWEKPSTANSEESEAGEKETNVSKVMNPQKRGYSPLPTLVPKFWLPTLIFDHDGSVFGALTAGRDVLGYHTYLAQIGYGVSEQGYYNAAYIYDRWYPSLFIQGYSLPVLYSEFFRDNDDYYERQSGFKVGIDIPVRFLEYQYSLVAGYHLEKLQHLTDTGGRTLDGLEVYEGRRDNVFVGIEYKGSLKYPYSISREEGRNFSLFYKDYSKNLGSGVSQREYSADYEEFLGLRRHHVAYLNVRGATSDGDSIAQQAFQLGGPPLLGNDYPLRGFSPSYETGESIVTGSIEYRFPIKYIFRGWNTKPFFVDRLHIGVFADAGNVWGFNKGFHFEDFSVGIGAEARLDMVLGYNLKITPAAGIAQGLTDDGETQVYLTIYTDL